MNLDDLFAHPDAPDCDMVVDFEAGDLREVREKITGTGWDRGYEFAAQNPHPRLWRLLAEKALEELDFAGAEKAFVSAEDYAGLQLVKQLRCMPDRNKAKAEIAVYMKRFDEAESIRGRYISATLSTLTNAIGCLHTLDYLDHCFFGQHKPA